MGAAVVNGRHLDVLDVSASVEVVVLDADIGEVHLLIEVRQRVVERPGGDLVRVPIGASIAVRTVAISLLQKFLVLALEFVVENDTAEAGAAPREAVCGSQVRAIHLDVVFQFARLPDACVKGLTGLTFRSSAFKTWFIL